MDVDSAKTNPASPDWKIKWKDYYGPIDALLDIIEKNKVLILDIDLCAITEQYNAYVQDLLAKSKLNRLKIDRISDYLILSQYLIRIKTLYLLQKQKDFLDEQATQFNWSQDALAQLLMTVQKYKTAIGILTEKQNERILLLSKESSSFEKLLPLDFDYEKVPDHLDSAILLHYYEQLNANDDDLSQEDLSLQLKNIYSVFNVSIKDLQELIMKYLVGKHDVEFFSMFKAFKFNSQFLKYFLVTLFLATLILKSENKITLKQDNLNLILNKITE